MKAFDILVFLVAFNLSLNLVILVVGPAAAPGADLEFASLDLGGFKVSGEGVLIALMLGIGLASVTLIGTEATKPATVAVGFFAGFYGLTLGQAMSTLSTFHIGDTTLIPPVIIGILIVFNIGVFIAAIMQMVTGGWRSTN